MLGGIHIVNNPHGCMHIPQPLMEEFKYVSREFSQLAMEHLADTEQYWIKYVGIGEQRG